MLYNIIQTKGGKETLKMTDTLQKCNDRIKQLRASYRGKNYITFRLEKSEDANKFAAKPLRNFDPSGDVRPGPPRINRKSK